MVDKSIGKEGATSSLELSPGMKPKLSKKDLKAIITVVKNYHMTTAPKITSELNNFIKKMFT